MGVLVREVAVRVCSPGLVNDAVAVNGLAPSAARMRFWLWLVLWLRWWMQLQLRLQLRLLEPEQPQP
jgi:hypothetical protein